MPAAPSASSSDRGAGLAAMVVALTAFSWGFIIIKAVSLPPVTISAVRLAIGVSVLSVAAVALRTPWPARRGAVLSAGVAFGVHQLAVVAATQGTTIAVVTLLTATQPLLVALASRRFVGERVPRRLYGSALLAFAGVGVVVVANLGVAGRTLAGDLWAVLSAVGYTGYFLCAKRAREQGAQTLTLTAAAFGVSLLVVAPVLLVPGQARVPDAEGAGLIALMALGPGNGHLLVNWAHPRVSAALSSLVLSALPLLSSIWARLVFGEPYTWRHALGMLLVLAAIETARRTDRVPASGPPV